MIDPAFPAVALAALEEVERTEGVRVLLAVESGSRAWGFASADSDYDVRFIFVRPRRDYLRVVLPREVIERPIVGALDLGGWDLRKALGLLVRSNATVLEWLGSPVVYRRDAEVLAGLRRVAAAAAHGPALAYHYDRLARGAWSAGTGEVRLKSYFYALRPVLAGMWLRRWGTPPPMDLPRLRAGVDVPDDVGAAIERLLVVKAGAGEADTVPREAVLEEFLADGLRDAVQRPEAWPTDEVRLAADGLFGRVVGVSG